MINLLADERKAEIRAARANMVIVRYMLIMILGAAFVLSALYVSHRVLERTMHNAETLIATNDVKADVYSETSQQVSALTDQLSGAKSILDQEVRFSKALVTIGQLMPANTVLDTLTLTSSAFAGTPVEVKAYAKTAADATTLQSKFQGSPLFSLVAIKGTETSGGIDDYPVVVTMELTFNKAGVQ